MDSAVSCAAGHTRVSELSRSGMQPRVETDKVNVRFAKHACQTVRALSVRLKQRARHVCAQGEWLSTGVQHAHTGLSDGLSSPSFGGASFKYSFKSWLNLQLSPRAQPSVSRGERILFVDDETLQVDLVTQMLKRLGYRVTAFTRSDEALAAFRENPDQFDLVITDIEMPRMDGLTLLKELKDDRRTEELPVILMSSVEKRSEIERGLNLGAEAYIVKRRFDHEELLQTITQVL